LKKIRKQLPEHISRLFNHENLTQEKAALLKGTIEEKIAFCCGHELCQDLLDKQLPEQKWILTKKPSVCKICRGSSTKRGMEEMAVACMESEIRRLLVVGGSPAVHKELNSIKPDSLEFRLVEGNVSRDKQRACADLNWCDLAILWAGTILNHDVSNNYMNSRGSVSCSIVVVKRRSVEALCSSVTEHVKRKLS